MSDDDISRGLFGRWQIGTSTKEKKILHSPLMSLQVIIVLLKFAFFLDKHFGLLLQVFQLSCQLIDVCVRVLDRLLVFVLFIYAHNVNPLLVLVLADKDRAVALPCPHVHFQSPFFSCMLLIIP